MLKSRIADHRLQIVTLAFCVVLAAIAAAQESPTPTLSSTPQEFPSPSVSQEESVPLSPTPEQTPSPSPARSIRISFVPPPMEGKISLGVYDEAGKLARVRHQTPQLNDLAMGDAPLATRWCGK